MLHGVSNQSCKERTRRQLRKNSTLNGFTSTFAASHMFGRIHFSLFRLQNKSQIIFHRQFAAIVNSPHTGITITWPVTSSSSLLHVVLATLPMRQKT